MYNEALRPRHTLCFDGDMPVPEHFGAFNSGFALQNTWRDSGPVNSNRNPSSLVDFLVQGVLYCSRKKLIDMYEYKGGCDEG